VQQHWCELSSSHSSFVSLCITACGARTCASCMRMYRATQRLELIAIAHENSAHRCIRQKQPTGCMHVDCCLGCCVHTGVKVLLDRQPNNTKPTLSPARCMQRRQYIARSRGTRQAALQALEPTPVTATLLGLGAGECIWEKTQQADAPQTSDQRARQPTTQICIQTQMHRRSTQPCNHSNTVGLKRGLQSQAKHVLSTTQSCACKAARIAAYPISHRAERHGYAICRDRSTVQTCDSVLRSHRAADHTARLATALSKPRPHTAPLAVCQPRTLKQAGNLAPQQDTAPLCSESIGL
jgi:hypothetical protein